MAADLGLEQPERLLEKFAGVPQTMRVSPCRQAGKVIGFSPHTDVCAMTLLLHVNNVQGLQIRRNDGKWLVVDRLDGALVISIGGTFEILSNGRYRSIEHRAMVHPDKERISVAMFHCVPAQRSALCQSSWRAALRHGTSRWATWNL
ncbi:hypothetical protein EJB05_30896 [Eragrostis curvula]|uniref:Fe2OG dioxygenase domain-containing protein n=1 Tax=Eragrostis curvula TaxID=38414 RepID=A0A5J9UBY7_9POAL|nr:hypothetical protein EJB05_30896 [Eragrostis curvula]